ncbi:hypothetical protein BACCOP_00622 [Phocaeicola coprocola DSM 17136]|uniref:Uncharacterized protein n=1 Tax=Phocaeicola coprocola DSM 17136 TaxID=470145 RepID=B3JFH3_9BACT|nr:hypothetical protein BACCOP_00622 [Phocaeicola coprocola DSM 17136]
MVVLCLQKYVCTLPVATKIGEWNDFADQVCLFYLYIPFSVKPFYGKSDLSGVNR